jgi:hypothetical protein
MFNILEISRKNSRKNGMFFKPSYKCLKNKKINFSPAILKLETLLYQNIYILFHLILYSQSDFDSKRKKSCLIEKKTCHMAAFFTVYTL